MSVGRRSGAGSSSTTTRSPSETLRDKVGGSGGRKEGAEAEWLRVEGTDEPKVLAVLNITAGRLLEGASAPEPLALSLRSEPRAEERGEVEGGGKGTQRTVAGREGRHLGFELVDSLHDNADLVGVGLGGSGNGANLVGIGLGGLGEYLELGSNRGELGFELSSKFLFKVGFKEGKLRFHKLNKIFLGKRHVQ